jgi:ubiquinone/menaquinone biosynthesis C-methylase UbiE
MGRRAHKGRARCLRKSYLSLDSRNLQKVDYLDIGAGDLQFTANFARDFSGCFALDVRRVNPEAKKNIPPKIKYVVGSVFYLPFKDQAFDLVSMCSVIEHLERRGEAIREAIRMLKPGGDLILEFPNRYFPVDPHSGLPNLIVWPGFLKKRFIRVVGYTDIPTPKQIMDLLRRVFDGRLRIKKIPIVWPAEAMPLLLRPLYCLLLAVGVFRWVPPAYLVVARRPSGVRI